MLAPMRASVIVFLVAVASLITACSGGQKPSATSTGSGSGTGSEADRVAARMDLHCTPQADFDEPACGARGQGCGYGPPLICRGVDVGDEVREQERRAYEAGEQPCECICQEDRERCAMVP